MKKYIPALCVSAFFAMTPLLPLHAQPLRGHEAMYSMTQIRDFSRMDSEVEGAQGLLHYTFRGVCDGWTVDHQTVLNMAYEGGPLVQMDWRYSGWESRDSKNLRFVSRTKRNGQMIEQYQGEARQEGKKSVAVYKDPNGRRVEMPGNVLFPTHHLLMALEKAKGKELVFSAPYFDGSADQAEFILDTVITPFKGKPLREVDGVSLPELPVWTLQLAFHTPGDSEGIADMEISARYREDGVATRLVQDFGDFKLLGELVEFKYLDDPDCK